MEAAAKPSPCQYARVAKPADARDLKSVEAKSHKIPSIRWRFNHEVWELNNDGLKETVLQS
jgi:hypothetical protein